MAASTPPMLPGMTVGERAAGTSWAQLLRQRRLDARLTQEEFARQLGVHQPELSRWERGVHTPSRLRQQLLQQQLHITDAELARL